MEAAAIDVGVAVAGEVATSLLAKLKKHFGYLYHYKDNLKALEEAKGPLEAKRTDGSHFSDDANRRLKDASATVSQWRSDADELHQKSQKLISRNNISCLNLWSRYRTSKHAWELTQDINKKVKSAPDFGTSFDRSITEGAKFNLKGYMEFDSRLQIQNDVLEALRNNEVSMCSICGMGGIGKTMMAKKIVKIVEADSLFDKVAMVTLTQNPNLEEIQKCIIESLELKLDESTMQGRAKKLNNWLSNNKTLLVLDDVWWQLHDEDFEKVGIPLDSGVCKIFVTSRNLDECVKMGSKPNIPLKDLEEGEAWELFVQNAGKCIEDTARKIVAECNGLPIAIVTIARALKGKPQGEWKDTLKKLQMSNLQGISDMERVYSKIQVSFDLLNDREAQSCLRLCCLFPEDYDVPIEKLVFYGWGLEIFEGADRLKEARDRVDSIVHKLKSSFLLLDSEEIGCVKLHDIVRDFAIWISFKDENPYIVRSEKVMEKWPENIQCEKSGAISFVCREFKNHPFGLRCPNLKLLNLQSNLSNELPDGFFDGMEGLRAVDLKLASKLPPLKMQRALRTLLIEYGLHQMVPLSEEYMKNLEILSFSYSTLSEFPKEIGMMCNLRCLRFVKAPFTYIPSGVLSKLVQLEELELPSTFNDWGIQGKANASLDEIASLPLTSITISLRKGSILAENIVKSLTSFRIFIESSDKSYDTNFDSNFLVVSKVDSVAQWTDSLLRNCHQLILHNLDWKYVMSQQLEGNNYYQTECLSQLTTLRIEHMNYLEEILLGTYLSNIQQPCFANLTEICIKNCPKLKRAFPLSVIGELTKLESVTLTDCFKMEAPFYEDQGDIENQVETSVKLNATSKGKQPKHIPKDLNTEERIEKASERKVDLTDVLPRLKRFIVGYRVRGMRCLSYVPGRLELKGFGKVNGHLKNISKWLPFAKENGIQRIKELSIDRCTDFKYLADTIAGPNFVQYFFSNLEELTLWDVDSLEEVWHGPYLSKIHSQCFSNLTELIIHYGPKMKHLFPLPVATQLRQLQVMKIQECKEIEEIFYKDHVDDENQVTSSVQLNNLTAETSITTTPTLVNLNKVETSSICGPTPTSFIQCLRPKGKQPKHLPFPHQSKEVNIQKVDLVIVFPRLKELLLHGMPKLRVVYNGNHAIECPSLEQLTITRCNNIEGLSYGSFSAPKINYLNLETMKNFLKWLNLEQDSGILLKQLRIVRCNEMTYRNLPKTLFCNLEELCIACMESLEEILHGPYFSIPRAQSCFSHLTMINIWSCPKLKHVFPLSVAMELIQLQHLEVKSCEEMEEIFYKVQVADGNQNASSAKLNSPTTGTASVPPYSFIPTHQIIEENIDKVDELEVHHVTIFPQLKLLRLEKMPKLQVMYNENHAIECPSLEELTIIDCNNMEDFSYGSFSAPKIKKLNLKNISKGLNLGRDRGILLKKSWIESRNEMPYLVNAVTDRNLPKTLFCNLEELWIVSMESLEEIWHGPYLSIAPAKPCFSHLTRITIWSCPKLKHVFPLSVAMELTQLQYLDIETCEEMEEIFYEDQEANGNQNASSVELNSLTTGTASAPPYSFIPTHQRTVNKTTTKEEVDAAMIDATIFPQLRYLYLQGLTKLRIFYDGNHAIELPSLEGMTINRCDKIEALSNRSFKAPKLKK